MSANELNDRPIRVGVWGPGTIGAAAIREVLLLPHLELASVYAFSDAKDGVDAGELANVAPTGVTATTNADEFLASEPDCVVHAPRDIGDWRADDELVMLLERGVNVVTVLPYHYPQAREGALERLDAAGEAGGATLFATGVSPGFVFERLAMTATGISNEVERLQVSEYINIEHITGGAEFLAAMGFGMETAAPEAVEAIAGTVANYLTQPLRLSAAAMGLTIDRIERADQHVATPVDLDVPNLFTLRAGTAALVSFRWTAHCEGGTQLIMEVKWYATDAMRPAEAAGRTDDFWNIEIDGRPSVRLQVELTGTFGGHEHHPDNPTAASMLATTIPAIQAIPDVVASPPGVLIAGMPRLHWREPGAADRPSSRAGVGEM